jgi:hypothetical protein
MWDLHTAISQSAAGRLPQRTSRGEKNQERAGNHRRGHFSAGKPPLVVFVLTTESTQDNIYTVPQSP